MKTYPGSIRCIFGAIFLYGGDGIIETSNDTWLAIIYVLVGTIMIASGLNTIQKRVK